MTFWIEPAHDNKRCGFMGRAGRIVWVWRFTWHFGRFRPTVPCSGDGNG